MGYDISAELADEIGKAKVFGSSDNIFHGRYKFLIRRIFAEKVNAGRFAFVEFTVLESATNPVPHEYLPECRDDGMHPNAIGTQCALKINFDGPGGQSAASNVKNFVLGLFGRNSSEISDAEATSTWKDLARQKPEMVDGKMKPANPGCGMVIACTTTAKEKRKTKLLPKNQKEYITALNWVCVSPPGTGENAPDMVAKRRADIEKNTIEMDDDDVNAMSTSYQPTQTQAAAPMPPAPPAPPVAASWAPPAPWRMHPTAPGYYWDGGQGVKSEAQLRNGA